MSERFGTVSGHRRRSLVTIGAVVVTGGAMAAAAFVSPAQAALPAAASTASPVGNCTTTGVVTYKPGTAGAPGGAQICVGQTGHHSSEQTLIVTPKGTIITGVDAGSTHGILRSTDQGQTWTEVTPKQTLDPTMGYITQDPVTHRIYASSMLDASCLIGALGSRIMYSDDDGLTWHTTVNQLCNGGDWGRDATGPAATAADQAALVKSGYPDMLYHCDGGTVQITRYCWKSTDGGNTFAQVSNAASEFPIPEDPAQPTICKVGDNDDEMYAGTPIVTPQGWIEMPVNACAKPFISISKDDGKTWTHQPIGGVVARGWGDHASPIDGSSVKGFIDPPNAGYPCDAVARPFECLYGDIGLGMTYGDELAQDSTGRLYFAWIDARDQNVHLQTSTDNGVTWTGSTMVAAPGLVRTSTVSIQLGSKPGQVALVYTGTRNTTGYDLGFDGFVSFTTDALDAGNATWTTAEVSPSAPLLPNGVAEPVEYAGLSFAPDGSLWADFSRDTCVAGGLHGVIPVSQCDGALNYANTRYFGVVAHVIPNTPIK